MEHSSGPREMPFACVWFQNRLVMCSVFSIPLFSFRFSPLEKEARKTEQQK